MAKIEILLDKANSCYTPSESISGKAVLTLDKQIKCRSIKARLMGKEWTMFTRGSGKHRTTYYAENKLVENEVILKEGGEMQPGTCEFPLAFTLPQHIPSSYSGAGAHIEYTLAVWADIPLWLDLKKEEKILVAASQPRPASAPVAISSGAANAQKPSFTINLRDSSFQAGQAVEGTMTAFSLQNSKARQAVIRLLAVEDAAAKNIVGMVHDKTTVRRSEITIPASELAYGGPRQFSMPIPAGSPPSFASKLTSIEWVLEASLDIPLWFDITAKGTITVYAPPDLRPAPNPE